MAKKMAVKPVKKASPKAIKAMDKKPMMKKGAVMMKKVVKKGKKQFSMGYNIPFWVMDKPVLYPKLSLFFKIPFGFGLKVVKRNGRIRKTPAPRGDNRT